MVKYFLEFMNLVEDIFNSDDIIISEESKKEMMLEIIKFKFDKTKGE